MEMEQQVTRRLLWRLLPLLIGCYFFAILDRGNVGVAALTMNKDIGLSATAFGFGAGVFFVPYFLFEVPSNIALARFGARRWIARILVSWGLLATATAFVWNPASFFVIHALLGAAEAGFFPGIIFYLMTWVPPAQRGRFTAYLMAALPVSALIGTPVGGLLLGVNGVFGLQGWQWLFLIEGLPAVALGIIVLGVLPDRPEDVAWLSEPERAWLGDTLAAERARNSAVTSGQGVWRNPRVWLLAAAYTGLVGLNAGLGVFLPLIFKVFNLSDFQTTLVASLPFLAGTVGILGFGWMSDRLRWSAPLLAAAVSVAGLVSAGIVDNPVAELALLCFGCLGIYGCMPVFWPVATSLLPAASAAAGIAIVNSVGNLAGFYNPTIIGFLRDWTGSYSAGLFWLAGTAAMAIVILILLMGRRGSATPAVVKDGQASLARG